MLPNLALGSRERLMSAAFVSEILGFTHCFVKHTRINDCISVVLIHYIKRMKRNVVLFLLEIF